MTEIGPTSIVVGIDGSESSLRAATFARAYADLHGLELVGAVVATDSLGLGHDDSIEPEVRDSLMTKVQASLGEAGITIDEVSVAIGHPATALTELASPAAALVVGARGIGGFSALLLGSTTSACLSHARCPVIVIPAQNRIPIAPQGRICVGVDGSAGSIAALKWALHEAAARPGCAVHAIAAWRAPHLWEPIQGGPSHYEERADRHLHIAVQAAGEAPVVLTSETKEGNAAAVLIDASSTSDLVVLGNDRHEGGRFDGGATPVAVASHSLCPVVIVP